MLTGFVFCGIVIKIIVSEWYWKLKTKLMVSFNFIHGLRLFMFYVAINICSSNFGEKIVE